MPCAVLAGVRQCVGRLVRPPIPASDYLASLIRLGLATTAAFLAEHQADWRL